MSRCSPTLLLGGTITGVLVSVLIGLGALAVGSLIGIIAAAISGTVTAAAAFRMIQAALILRPLDAPMRAVPEMERVIECGYEICFRQGRASKSFQRWVFAARRDKRTVGCIDVGYIEAKKCLYVSNVCVQEPHGHRGVGTALLLCAVKTTCCKVVATSSRTSQGAVFFEKTRPLLSRHGIQLLDRPGRKS